MHLIKISLLIIIWSMQLATFCIAAGKFISATKLKDKMEYLLIAIAGLVGFIFLTNPVMYVL